MALLGGIGYFAWRQWKKWQQDEGASSESPAGTAGTHAQAAAPSAKHGSKGSPFCFDKQPRGGASTSTSGRTAPAPASSAQGRGRSRHEPKPKSQKQLRKEAKAAKKAARDQAARDAESGSLAAAIAKRAADKGLGPQAPEPERHYSVDYEGVARAMDRIVEWQQTGKKKY